MSLESAAGITESAGGDNEVDPEYEYTRTRGISTGGKALGKDRTYESGDWTSELDERYFTGGSPNDPPAYEVDKREPVDIEILEDESLVEQTAAFMFPGEVDRYTEVARITYNDMSTWHIPLPPWEKDCANFREHIVGTYVAQAIKAQAELDGRDGDEELRQWQIRRGNRDPDWFSDVAKTDMSEENRQWFNENMELVPDIPRTVQSVTSDPVSEVDVDSDWEDDW